MIFITGGVRSGKSRYAEKRAIALHRNNGGRLHYVATSRVYDAEMAERVYNHEKHRQKSGVDWIVHEKQTDVERLFPLFHKDDVVLIDCVTTLVSNELFVIENGVELWRERAFFEAVRAKLETLFFAIAHAPWEAIVVSNELLFEATSNDVDTERYKWLLATIHAHIVRHAKEAIVVECGIPRWWKGGKR